jgi:hypothetical protein
MNQTNQIEARTWVAAEISKLRNLSYCELVKREGDAEHRQMRTDTGKPLILERQILWDDADKDERPSDGGRMEPGETNLVRQHRERQLHPSARRIVHR